MPTDVKRLSQKRNTPARPSPETLLAEGRQAAFDTLILNPETPCVQLVNTVLEEHSELSAMLGEMLTRNFWLTALRGARREQSAAERAQDVLPGFEALPFKIPGAKRSRIRLLDADYTRVRAYYRSLTTGYDARKQNDPKVKAAKALMERMHELSQNEPGITVREVMEREAAK